MPRRFLIAGFATCLVATLASPAPAQSWELQDEIGFAKNMARYRLFDLATEYIQKLERGNLSPDDRNSCLYARAFIEKLGGDYDTTVEGRLALLKDAVGHYNEFLGKIGADHPNADDARGELAQSQRKLGALHAEIAAAGTDPEGNRKEAETAFRSAVQQLNALHNARMKRVEAMPDPEEDPDADPEETARSPKEVARIEAFEPVYELAATYYEWAQLYPQNDLNREDYLKKAVEQATTYIWEVPSTIRSYDASYYAGVASVGLNQMDEGLANLEYIIAPDTGIPAVIEQNADLPPEFVGELTKMVERTYLELARLWNKREKYADAEKLQARVDDFYKRYGPRGAKRSLKGEEFLLEIGLARFRAGQSGGMKLLEEVSKRNQGNEVGQRAGELMVVVLRDDAGGALAANIPPSTWIATAEASRNQNKMLDAIDSYHNAIGATGQISDAKERARVAVACWNDIGACYRSLQRYVEAALAFQQGLALCSGASGIEEEVVQQVGTAWYNTLVARFKETKTDADKRAKDTALRKLASDYKVADTEYLVAKDEFEQARILPSDKKAERAAAFAEVAKQLTGIKEADANYDRARILLARCQGEQGDGDPKKWEQALKTLDAFDEYERKHEPPADKKRIVNREISRTESRYYRSEYQLALGQHAEVLETLKSFEKDFPTQKAFFPEVNYRQLMALLALGRLADAEAHFVTVSKRIEAGELMAWRDSAGYWLARAYLDHGTKESDPAKQKALLAKGAELMWGYCRATAWQSYNNLLTTAETWAKIEQWARAEEAYRKLVEVFGKEAQYKENIDLRVKRTLAEVLMAQRKFGEAAPLYRELEVRYPKDPTLMRQAALCYGGWVDVVDRKPVEVPGAGDYERAVQIWQTLVERGFTPEQDKTPPWFEAKFMSIYSRYRAKDVAPNYFQEAKTLIDNYRVMVWDFFKDEPDFVEARLGGPDWQRRWEYLFERVR